MDVLGYKIGVLTEAITRTLDLNDDGVMEEPIEECSGDNVVTKNLAPFCEAAVRSKDHSAFFVSRIDELEEQIAAAGDDGQVADFIDDEQREAAKEPGGWPDGGGGEEEFRWVDRADAPVHSPPRI